MRLRLQQNVAWALAEVIASGLILFFLYRIVVKDLGVEALGIWSMVMATTSLGRLADIGTAAGLGRFVAIARAQNDDRKAMLIAETAILTNLVLYLGIAAVLWAPAHYGLSLMASGISLEKARELLPYTLLSFVLMSVTAATTGALVGQQRSDQRSMVTIASLFVQFTVALLFVPHYGLPGLAWAQTAQYLSIVCASWTLFLNNHSGTWTFRVPLRWRFDVLKELIGFGVKLQAVSIVSFLFEPTVKFLMSAFGGLETLGFYEMAQRLVLQVRQLIAMPNQALVPGFAHLKECEPEKIEPLYHKAMALTVATGLPLLAGVAVASPVISAIWIGHVDHLFVLFTLLLAAGWFANLLAAPAYLLGVALGYLRWNFIGTMVTTVGAALLSCIFGFLGGKFGVAVPAMAMLGVGSVSTMVMNCRALGIRLFPARSIFSDLHEEIRARIKKAFFNRCNGRRAGEDIRS